MLYLKGFAGVIMFLGGGGYIFYRFFLKMSKEEFVKSGNSKNLLPFSHNINYFLFKTLILIFSILCIIMAFVSGFLQPYNGIDPWNP